VEGENLVPGTWQRLLDPTIAVSDAVALHRGIERYGRPPYSWVRQQIPGRVPRLSYKHCAIHLLVLTVIYIVHNALPNHKNDSIPSRTRVVGKRTYHQEESVSRTRPASDIQIAVYDHGLKIRR